MSVPVAVAAGGVIVPAWAVVRMVGVASKSINNVSPAVAGWTAMSAQAALFPAALVNVGFESPATITREYTPTVLTRPPEFWSECSKIQPVNALNDVPVPTSITAKTISPSCHPVGNVVA
jgi:hypothetical protein